MRPATVIAYGPRPTTEVVVVVRFDNGDGTTEDVTLPPFTDDPAHLEMDRRILAYEAARDRQAQVKVQVVTSPSLGEVRDYSTALARTSKG
jgi:hypothetical protein